PSLTHRCIDNISSLEMILSPPATRPYSNSQDSTRARTTTKIEMVPSTAGATRRDHSCIALHSPISAVLTAHIVCPGPLPHASSANIRQWSLYPERSIPNHPRAQGHSIFERRERGLSCWDEARAA